MALTIVSVLLAFFFSVNMLFFAAICGAYDSERQLKASIKAKDLLISRLREDMKGSDERANIMLEKISSDLKAEKDKSLNLAEKVERLRSIDISPGTFGIERINRLLDQLNHFNCHDLGKIKLMLNGQHVVISPAALNEWRFLGLSNEAFIELGCYTADGQKKLIDGEEA